jgi:hypothetical protein
MKAVITTALVLVVATVGVAALFLNPSTNSVVTTSETMFNSTYSASTHVTQTIGSITPDGCGTLANSVSGQGYEVETYVSSTSANKGSSFCIDVVLLNVSGRNVTVESGWSVSYNITDSGGQVFFQTVCAPSVKPQSPGAESSTFTPMHYASCAGEWNTSTPINGVTPQPGTYKVTVSAKVPSSGVAGYSTINSNSTLTVAN